MNIFVGSLPFSLKEEKLQEIFEAYGEVTSAKIITDKYSGRSKGFGFVEMPDLESAKKAIEELNGAEVEGRALVVNESEPRKEGDRSNKPGGFNKGGGFNRNNNNNRRDDNRRNNRY